MKRMRMFLSTMLAAILLVSACAHAEAGFAKKEIETLDASVPFDSEFGQIAITGVDEGPALSPAEMTEEQRAVMISLTMPLAFLEDLEGRDAKISSEFFLLSPAGMLRPGAVTQKDGEDGSAAVNLVFAIPKDSALVDHRLVFSGQARAFAFSEDAKGLPTGAEADVPFAAGLTSPEQVSVTFEETAHIIRVVDIGLDEDGNRTVTIDGMGEVLHIRNNSTIAHIQLEMFAGGETYDWSNMSIKDGLGTFSFDTTLYPEVIRAYSYDDDTRVEMHVTAEAVPSAEVPTPKATSTAEPTAAPVADMAQTVSDLLAELSQAETDPWRLAIYEAGAQEVAIGEESVSFLLRSFNPGLKRLGNYKADKAAYLRDLLLNATAYDLEVKLALAGDAIGTEGKGVLRKTIENAASAAQAAFKQKAVRIAIVESLFTASEGTDDARAPLFQAQAKQSLSVSDGPHALLLRCSGANPEALLETARANVYTALAKIPGANQSEPSAVREEFLKALSKRAAAIRKKPDENFTLTLDVDDLVREDIADYYAYLERYTFDEVLDALLDQVDELPDAPAQDFPKSGRISGSTKGTKVIVKAPNDGEGRYIQLRSVDTDKVMVTGFIRPGSSCTVRVPKGDCYILVASGTTWHGEKVLFGDAGSYSRTEAFEVLGSNYYHTITLGGVVDGNMSSYGASASDFQ